MIWDLLLVVAVLVLIAHAYVLFRDRWPRQIRMPHGYHPPTSSDGVQRLRGTASPGHDLGRADN